MCCADGAVRGRQAHVVQHATPELQGLPAFAASDLVPNPPPPLPQPPPRRAHRLGHCRQDGQDGTDGGRILVGCLGLVFDMADSANFYGPGAHKHTRAVFSRKSKIRILVQSVEMAI